MKKLFLITIFFLSIILMNSKYFEIEYSYLETGFSDSLIGLTINNTPTTNFPSKESGLAIDSIVCDKGANGVWDYKNWLLKIRNVTENRTKCQVNFVTKYTESILNGTDPVLKEGLIPVLINDEGEVTKSSEGWEWYDYETQKWANAVILSNGAKEYYDGDIIPEEEIESYFVWIPRYQYKLWYLATTVSDEIMDDVVEIKFSTSSTVDNATECKTPNKSGESGTCSVGKYMTHPAFTSFDTEDNIIKGMWVGKFETGYKSASTPELATQDVVDINQIQIKPNVYSWRNINPANAHLNAYHYKREYDSHMMKSTEWGAVTYLSHSKYGNPSKIRLNNNTYLTGYAAVSEPTCGYRLESESCNVYESTNPFMDGIYTINYKNKQSVIASTTGNYTGIYDMAGGAAEHVMGIMADENGMPASGKDDIMHSNFIGALTDYAYGNDQTKTTWTEIDGGIPFPESKYYDLYTYLKQNITMDNAVEGFSRRILGDATSEKNGLFSKTIPQSHAPFAVRGNAYNYGTFAVINAINRSEGGAIISTHGFRIVLMM